MSGRNWDKKIKKSLKQIWVLILITRVCAAADLRELEAANAKAQWNDAAEISYEILSANPSATLARLQGAYALFQKGYSNSALVWMKPLTPKDWKSFPQGEDRFAEIISLFQKKVPLTLLPGRLDEIAFDEASPYLRDELTFAKGREAFEKHDPATVKSYLQNVAKGSRYFPQAHYLLGAAAVESGDYKTAMAEFSNIFQSAVLDQATEFWQDLSAQMTTHWGANLRIALDAQSVRDSEKVGELALLGLARSAYATKQFEQALNYYSRIPKTSAYYSTADLERIWTLLALNRHEDAQKAAAELSVNDQSFHSLEARTVRALILTDIGRTDEARGEIDSFFKAYKDAKAALQNFETTKVESTLPAFLKVDLANDVRLKSLTDYQETLSRETDALRKEDPGLFPIYADLPGRLEPLLIESKGTSYRIVQEHVARRREDLDTLFVQAKLITVEMYLEDREKLRNQFKKLIAEDPTRQAEHDRRLVELLQNAVQTVDDILPQVTKNKVRLEFRQSELLWELGTARAIVAQTTKNKAEQVLSDQLKARSLQIAEMISEKNPDFERHSQAMFFAGYAEIEVDRIGDGTRMLERYVKLYPRDSRVADAYRILADLQFDDNHFSAAEALYQKILTFPDSPIVGYALYKIGWCAYNLKDFARALLGLEKAVRWVNGSPANQVFTLKRESRHDLISLYAEVGDSRKALDYFGKFFQGDTAGWISDLAGELDRTGQFEKSADLYRTLVALEPSSQDNVVRQASIINGRYHLHDWPGVLAESGKLVQDYKPMLEVPQPDGSPAAVAEKIMRETVLAQLFEYQKSPDPELAARVSKLDDLYLSAFGRWPSSQEPLYKHAHFLLAQEKFPEAVEVFKKHWAQFRSTLPEPVREESLRNLIYALDKSGDPVQTGPVLLQFTDEYAKNYPKTKYTRSMRFLRSTVFFKLGHPDDGIRETQTLFEENPADDIGRRSFKNLRVAYYDLKDWERTYNWAATELGSSAPGMKLYAEDLKTVHMEALFQWADQSKDDTKSGDLFLRIANDPEMKRLHEKSLYNAFVRYHKAGKDVEALEVAKRLDKDYPDFESLPEIAGVRAALYQEAGDYTLAYPYLGSFVEHPSKNADASMVLTAKMNLALISEALGKSGEASRLYENYLKLVADRETPAAKEAKRGLERIKRTERVARESDPALTPFQATWVRLEKSRLEFEKMPLPPTGDLPGRIKKGGERLERVAQEFADASTSSGVPAFFAFESYCSLPSIYAAYSRAVLKSSDEIPGLKEGERQEVKNELSKITDPIQLKIRSLADQCLTRSAESLHDGPRYRDVLESLGWMADPALKQRAREILAGLEKGSPWLDPAKTKGTEDEILRKHLLRKGDEESWYELALVRWDRNQHAASRLTLVDALALNPGSGRILNALGAIDQDPALYELAAQKGSPSAWANLAYFHLKAGRLTQAERALEQGLAKDAFDQDKDLKRKIQELVKK